MRYPSSAKLETTPGNVGDIKMAIPLLEAARAARRLLADKAYDADSLRRRLAKARVEEVIPSSAARRTPYPLNRKHIEDEVSSNAFSAISRTGAASQHDMIASPATISRRTRGCRNPMDMNESPS